MSFVSPTNHTPPANNPPVLAQQQQQQQQQAPGPTSELEAYFNDIDNNESEAQSESSSRGDVSQSAIQINNIQAGEYGYGPGITRPTPFLSGTMFLNDSDNGRTNYGGQVSLVIPIGGGKSSRLSENLIAARTTNIVTTNTKNLLAICNSARAQNLRLNYDVLPENSILHGCRDIFIPIKEEVTQKDVDNSTALLLKQMQSTIEQLERTNESLQQQLNNINAPNPYKSTGG